MSSRPRHRGGSELRSRMWAALAIAVALHVGLLLVKFREPSPAAGPQEHVIDVELTSQSAAAPQPRPAPPAVVQEPPAPPVEVAARPPAEPDIQPAMPPTPPIAAPATEPAQLNPEQVRQLARRIIASPYLEDTDDTVKIFGRPPAAEPTVVDFRVPDRPDMFSMLEGTPIDLPFADPEFVEFAYAPGAMGAIQRGFDHITPEFGWTSNTGFKIRCRWVLIVVGCGWGR